jgi:NADH-quinone oxidoreductase subunit J
MLTVLLMAFALIALGAALAVVTAKNPVRAVMALIVAFVATAGIWMALHAEYLSLALIVVYVGAVMVLFLFVVMMLDIDVAGRRQGFVRFWPLVLLVPVAWAALLYRALRLQLVTPPPQAVAPDSDDIAALGNALFNHYLYAFEAAAVLLLAAMIAAIMLTFRRKETPTKKQRIKDQLAVSAKSRLRLINLKDNQP